MKSIKIIAQYFDNRLQLLPVFEIQLSEQTINDIISRILRNLRNYQIG